MNDIDPEYLTTCRKQIVRAPEWLCQGMAINDIKMLAVETYQEFAEKN